MEISRGSTLLTSRRDSILRYTCSRSSAYRGKYLVSLVERRADLMEQQLLFSMVTVEEGNLEEQQG